MGFVIELDCKDDGTIVVSGETEAAESAEESGSEAGDASAAPAAGGAPATGDDTDNPDGSDAGVTCHDIKGALVEVLKLYKAQGQAAATDSTNQFAAGYGAGGAPDDSSAAGGQ